MTHVGRIFTMVAEHLAGGGGLLLLTDYDGTLSPLVPDPEDARLGLDVRGDLGVLARSRRVRVGILSGRSLADLGVRVGLSEVIYGGCHGLEVQGPGLSFRHPRADAWAALLQAVAEAVSARLASMPGVRLEPKGLAIAVHYRNAPSGAAGELRIQLDRVIHPLRDRLRLLRGSKVIEILPRVRWNKGDCALWIRERVMGALARPVVTLYMGDDRTDELAFRVLQEKAITARVGPLVARSTAAYRLRDVTDVHRLLSALVAEVLRQEAMA